MADTADDLNTFFQVSLDMLCIRDSDYRFVRVNDAWTATLGWTPAELEGRPMLDFVHPDDRPKTAGRMTSASRDKAIVGFINRYRHRDGGYRHLEWHARQVGERVFAVARDVTERLATEAEIKDARVRAEAANQAKGEFLANISHEIRTPLNGVIGVISALAQTELTTAQREMVEMIAGSGTTLERLVSDLLDVAKMEAGRMKIEPERFDLHREIDGLLDMVELSARAKGLKFQRSFGAMATTDLVADATRIKQVLGNLLSNAVKFTPRGRVGVHIEVLEPDGAQGPLQLTMEVSDEGIGFEPALTAALFQRFQQADATITRRFGGTGLGLSICGSLVAMMDGRIDVESAPGQGSVFRVTLPVGAGAPVNRVAFGSAHIDLPPGLRVLLAEDHPINRRLIELILSPFGASITTAEDGAQAIRAFAANAFDVVLMDMQMPVVDGLAAIRSLRLQETLAGRPHTPVVMLSANAMTRHRNEALAAGADLHLAKPVTPAAVIGAIREALSPLPSAVQDERATESEAAFA